MHTHLVTHNSRPYQLIEMHNYMYYINPTFNIHFDNSMIIIDLGENDISVCVTIPDMSGSDTSMVTIDMSGSDTSMSMIIIPLLPIVTDISGSEPKVDIVDIKSVHDVSSDSQLRCPSDTVESLRTDPTFPVMIHHSKEVVDQELSNIDVDVKDVSDTSMILVGTIGDKSIIILSEDCSGIYLNKNDDIIQINTMKDVVDVSSCVTTIRPLDISGVMHHYYHHSVYDTSRVVLDTSGSGHFHYHNPTVTLDIRGVPNYHYVIYLCEYHIKDVVDEIPTSTE